jgi:hypothetical protein
LQTRWAHRLEVYVPTLAHGIFEHLRQRRNRLLNSEMLLDSPPPGMPEAQSQVRIAQQLFKCVKKRRWIAGRS